MPPDFLTHRRTRVAAALPLENAILLVGAGGPVPLPEGSDQVYPFRSHAEYYYLAGAECAGGVLAFDPRDGAGAGWCSFVPRVTESERIWEGRAQLPGAPLGDLETWLAARRGRPVAMLGARLSDQGFDEETSNRVRDALTHARRPKDAHELDSIRRATAATAPGYAKLQAVLRPGVTERALQVELEAEFFRLRQLAAGGSASSPRRRAHRGQRAHHHWRTGGSHPRDSQTPRLSRDA